jgi:O-antigen ligase
LPTQFGKHFWPQSSFVYGLRLDYLSPTIYLTDIFIILIFVFSLPALIKILRKINKKYLVLFLFFVLSLFLGINSSKNFFAGVYGLTKFFEFSFLALYIYKNIKIVNKKIIFYCFSISLIFESLLSFLQYINQGSIGSLFYFFGERQYSLQTPGVANASINGQLVLRTYATFSHPNVLAGFLVITMFFLFLFLPKGGIAKTFLIFTLFLGTLSLFLSLSRTSIVAWFICLFLLFCFSVYKKYKKGKSNIKTSVFIGSALIILGLLFMFQNSLLAQRFLSTSLLDESIIQREDLFRQAINMFEKNPVFGVGLNNFYNNLNPFSEKIFLIQPVHNIFMLALSQAGIIGFLFLVSILVLGFIKIINIKTDKRKYFLCIFFSLCFLGMFDHYFLTLQQGQLLFALFLGTALASKNLS